MARVVLENVSKIFKGAKGEEIRSVQNARLTVEDKEFLVLVGPSGCGKTTTLRLIAGLEDASHGTIAIDGEVVNALPPQHRDVAMVFQNYSLYPHMTVFENMAFGLKLRKFPKSEIQRRVKEAAEILGLTPYFERSPNHLSGGQRQRVALGRAIVRQPRVFLFDEPLSNLDPPMRAQMRTEILKLHTRLQATIIYVTHDQLEAMTMGGRIAVMKNGVIQQVGDPIAVYNSPANLFVAGFIGSPPMNFFQGALIEKGGSLFFAEHKRSAEGALASFTLRVEQPQASRLSSHVGRNLLLGIRPEHIRLPATSEGENTVNATVELVERMGWETHLHLTTAAHRLIVRVPASQQTEFCRTLSLTIDLTQAHFFDPQTEAAIA